MRQRIGIWEHFRRGDTITIRIVALQICAGYRGLDVAKGRVDPFEGGSADRSGSRAGYDDLMRTPGIFHAAETSQAVADRGAVRIQAAFGEHRDRMAAKTSHPAQLQANRLAVRRGFDAATNAVLPGAPRPRLPPVRSPPR